MNAGPSSHIYKPNKETSSTASSEPFWAASPANKPGPRGPYMKLTARRKELIRRAYADDGLVPLAIPDRVGLSMRTVARYLRELEADGSIPRIPAYLSMRGVE